MVADTAANTADIGFFDIINLHEYAGQFVQKPISIFDSVELLRAINDIKKMMVKRSL